MAHCMIKSGALHPCDKNKQPTIFTIFCAFHILCTSFLGNVIFTLISFHLEIFLTNPPKDGISHCNHPIIIQYAYHTSVIVRQYLTK